MRLTLTIVPLFLITQVFSQTFKEKGLKTEIKEVTVFLNGAQVFESGEVSIPIGKSILKIMNLSPFIDEKSIQVKADGDFTILSVNHKLNYLNASKKDEKIDSLRKLVDEIELTVSRSNARLGVLKEKQSLLNENKKLGGENSGVTIVQLKQAIELYETEITRIKEEEITTNRKIQLMVKEQGRIEQQLKELNEQNALPNSEIEIRVSSEHQVNAKVSLTYLVSNAGWYPKYDIRVENIKSPLVLTYKAEVFQNTGVDWKNVKLRFSNGDPNQSGVVPELKTWNLNFARNTTQLSEAAVASYGVDRALQGMVPGVQISAGKSAANTVPTTVIENQTTVEIEVVTPFSVKSNGEKLQVDLRKHQIEALYEYYAIPKLDKDAFLVARIINWDQYNLLDGEANLYFEDAYVGRSILNARSLQDTLAISLGRDKNIVVGREKIEQYRKKKTIGSNIAETRGIKIVARNKKSQPIKLTIFDQIPLSVVSDIIVSPLELTSGRLDEKTGKVTWELTIDAQQQKDINLQYEVKYPKREKVILE